MNAGRRCQLSHGCRLLSTPFGKTLIPLFYPISFYRMYGLYSKQQKNLKMKKKGEEDIFIEHFD